MNASEHIAQALIHLEAAANANYDHLLREQRHTEWNREVLWLQRARLQPEALLTEVHAIWAKPTESWTIPDLRFSRDEQRLELGGPRSSLMLKVITTSRMPSAVLESSPALLTKTSRL